MLRLNLVRIADSVGAFDHLVPGDAGNRSILEERRELKGVIILNEGQSV